METSEEFGSQGEPPTHPELLDWLALELVDQDWSLKEMHAEAVKAVPSPVRRMSHSVLEKILGSSKKDDKFSIVLLSDRKEISSLLSQFAFKYK